MNYYILEYSEDDEIDNFIMINEYDLKGFDYRKLWTGHKLDSWKNDIKLLYENEGILLDNTPNVLSWMILSDNVINVFKELCITEFESFNVKLYNKSNDKIFHFSNVINITCENNILNWEKSDLITWEDDPKYIKFIKKLVIDSSSLNNTADIFRLAECKNYIIVSERFKNKIEERGLTGFYFCEIELSNR